MNKFVVTIMVRGTDISPIVIGPFDSRADAQDWGNRFDFRLCKDQIWSVSIVCQPKGYYAAEDVRPSIINEWF